MANLVNLSKSSVLYYSISCYDIFHRLSYYERNFEFLSQKELISQVQSHYTGQALKQLYVLVLGLDVLGNPYGLVVGLKKGVEDLFYEPFQVIIALDKNVKNLNLNKYANKTSPHTSIFNF